MKKYKVLKDYIHPQTYVLRKPGYEFNYISEYTDTSKYIDTYMKVLEREGFIEEIPEQPKTVWDLKQGDEYYAIASDGFITTEIYLRYNTYEDISRVNIGNAFITKEEAEKELARRKAKVILERDTKGFKPDWGNMVQSKYEVYYDYKTHTLEICYCYVSPSRPDLWFATQEDAEESIKAHLDEWKIYLGVEE